MSFGCDMAEISYFDGSTDRVEGLRVGLFLIHERAARDELQRDIGAGGWRATRQWKVTHVPSGRAVDFSDLRTALRIADLLMLRCPVSESDCDGRPLPDAWMDWLRECVIADRLVSALPVVAAKQQESRS